MNNIYEFAYAAFPWIILGLIVAVTCTKMKQK